MPLQFNISSLASKQPLSVADFINEPKDRLFSFKPLLKPFTCTFYFIFLIYFGQSNESDILFYKVPDRCQSTRILVSL